MLANTFPITLIESKMISKYVKHFQFSTELNPAFNYIAGQFITIHFEKNGKMLKRSYSIANIPEHDNRIEFAAGFVKDGPGTELLFNLKPGDKINISGPFGRLILKNDEVKRYILVATSTGVTPYRAMLKELETRFKQNPFLKVIILHGVQKSADVLYKEDFLNFAAKHPNQFEFRAHLSRGQDEALANHECLGYVQSSFNNLQLNPNEDLVYLCGNPGMIDESFAYLKEQGFGMQQIIREKYISAPTR